MKLQTINGWIANNGVTGQAVKELPYIEMVCFIVYALNDYNARNAAAALGMEAQYTTFVYRLNKAKEGLRNNNTLKEYAKQNEII